MRRAAIIAAAALALAAPTAALAGHGHGKHKKGIASIAQLDSITSQLPFDKLKEALASLPDTSGLTPLLTGLDKADALSGTLGDALATLQGKLKAGASQSDIDAAKAAVAADVSKLEKQGARIAQAMDKLAASAVPGDLAKAQQAFELLSNQLKQVDDIKTHLIGNLR